jgi:hypothetical protein
MGIGKRRFTLNELKYEFNKVRHSAALVGI